MAMRRRIKVSANLITARKPKTEAADNSTDRQLKIKVEPAETFPDNKITEEKPAVSSFTTTIKPKTEPQIEPSSLEKDAFKHPPKVEYNRSNSYTATQVPTDDHIEAGDGVQVMQMDLQKTANQMSPLKLQRQRIKATPVFGQRRNSFVGAPLSPSPNEDVEHNMPTPRRERHYSGSHNLIVTPNFTPQKPACRLRTESSCSVFSDSHMSITSKSRKTDDKSSHRLNLRREFEARFSNGIPEKSNLKMSDLLYYNPMTNPMEQKPKIIEIKSEIKIEPDVETNKDNLAIPVPQLKLNAKGELILDDKSLEIETTAEQEARKVLAQSSLIYLDENTGMNGFYKRHKRTRDWSPEETIRFYRCLQTIGTDFSLMCQLFPKRTRRDIKLKFKKEERCNGALINKAILHPNSFNLDELKDQFDTEDREREEKEKKKDAKKKEYKKINVKTSKSARALKNADDVYNLCEGHLDDNEEEETRKQKRKAAKEKKKKLKKTENKIVAENYELHTTRKKRKIKKRHTSETPIKEKEISSLIPTECEIKQEQTEKLEHTSRNPTYPIYEISKNNITTPEQFQDNFNMLIEDDDTESNNNDQYDDLNELEEFQNIDVEESRTFVNLDNGNLMLINDKKIPQNDIFNQSATFLSNDHVCTEQFSDRHDVVPREGNNDRPMDNYNNEKSPENCVATIMDDPSENPSSFNVDELTIQQILEDIASGTLQVVSSYDPSNPDETTTEIYLTDPNTGELCDEPLDLPNDLVQSILSVMI